MVKSVFPLLPKKDEQFLDDKSILIF
jgi:hypothetical protein